MEMLKSFLEDKFVRVHSVRHADYIWISGAIYDADKTWLINLYKNSAKPVQIFAIGTCAISGRVFDSIRVSDFLPVEKFIPGCPPNYESILEEVK